MRARSCSSSNAFANRTVAALGHEPVRRVVAREIVVQVIDRGSSDLVAARPVITSVVDTVVATRQFRGTHPPARRTGAPAAVRARRQRRVQPGRRRHGRRLRAANARAERRQEDPARRRRAAARPAAQSFAVRTLRTADDIRTLGSSCRCVALALLALAVAIGPAPAHARHAARVALAVARIGRVRRPRAAAPQHAREPVRRRRADQRPTCAQPPASLWELYLGDLGAGRSGSPQSAAIVAAASASVLRPAAPRASPAAPAAGPRPPRAAADGRHRGVVGARSRAPADRRPTLALDVVVVPRGRAVRVLRHRRAARGGRRRRPRTSRLACAQPRAGIAQAAASLGV